jgi:hypothetical protein
LAADQLVVPVAVPDPPRLFAHVTCVTLTLSLAVPPIVRVGALVEYTLAEAGAVMATVGASVSAAKLTTTLLDVTPLNDAAVKVSVRGPAVPLIDRLLKVANPLDVVVAVFVPPSVPPPDAIAAVTTTPARLTTAFPASRS